MINFDLKNRVAIVTGGAQGFGLAITERFIESGASVVIWDIDEEAIKTAISKINSDKVSYQIVDVGNYESIEKNLIEIEKQANKMSKWGKNVYVKIPVVNSKGLFSGSVIKELSDKGIKLNITAVYTYEQAKKIYGVLNKKTKSKPV